jgi:hypothetical protein
MSAIHPIAVSMRPDGSVAVLCDTVPPGGPRNARLEGDVLRLFGGPAIVSYFMPGPTLRALQSGAPLHIVQTDGTPSGVKGEWWLKMPGTPP